MTISQAQKIIFAARSGNLKLLIERTAAGSSVNIHDPIHGSPLLAAIIHNHAEIVDWLIEHGVDVNHEHHLGIGPLEVALHHQNTEIVRKLI